MNQVADSDALKTELEFAVALARAAGEITLRYFGRRLNVETKADDSPVTVADRETETFLRAEITNRFPTDAILGEEFGEQSGTSGRRWIVDPIDGTFSFIRGVPLYGVLIGLEQAGEAHLGVAHVPALSETVYARRGGGCFWNGEPARVSNVTSLTNALVLATDFGTCAAYGLGETAVEIERRARARRTWGDCYGHLLIATGRADVMLDPVLGIWDAAALLPILEEAGGTFTDWNGVPTINGGNGISTNRALLQEILQIRQAS